MTWQEVLGGLALTIIGALLGRAVLQLDTSVSKLTEEVSRLNTAHEVQKQLNEFQQGRLQKVEAENSALHRILKALDKILYARLGIDINEL